jgi:Protein of unknown function (DUF1565)/Putative metal-binding motif
MGSTRWLAALLALSACLNAPREVDCLDAGTCECRGKADCAPAQDCLDGRCVLIPDAGVGEQGWPCATDADCRRGPCLPPGPGNGRVCSTDCSGDAGFACGGGWQCKANLAAHGFDCVPPMRALCLPCARDSDCNALGDLCLSLGGASGCGQDCARAGCPQGYSCRSLALDAGVARQCIPDTGTCACSAASAGLQRACKNANSIGTCFGVETCQPSGVFSGCDAPDASVEVCDGLDNDCNGLIDQADPNLVTTGVPGYPDCRKGLTCVGKWSCGPLPDGGAAFQCSAPDPRPEVCNGVDDNCNGLIDEGLVDVNGNYVTVRACGSCAGDCYQVLLDLARDGGAVVDGAATCEQRAGVLTCVPRRCAPGYYPSPPAAPQVCAPAVSSQCRPCTITDDCQVPGDQCVTVGNDPGTFCAQSCDPASPYLGCQGRLGEQDCCPQGALCQFVNGQRQCVPRGNSCLCDPSRAGFARSCFVSNGVNTCVGQQTCDLSGAFGSCDTSRTTIELCDGRDNNCNNLIDEPFINTQDSGTYDTDQHCGSCTNDCTARWSATIQHAVGGCVVDGGVPGCAIVACTTDTVPGGGACRVDADCGPGRSCQAGTYQCVEPCAPGCAAGEQCVSGLCAPTCSGDAQCQALLGSPSRCGAGGTCEVSYQFVNADHEDTNGCECAAAQGVIDEPDVSATYPAPGIPYVDRNCDHVDGVAATAVYVWALSPSSQGTRTAPFRTLAEALAAFRPGVHSAILVAQGTYLEQVVLRDGVSLYGGYSADFFHRDVILYPTLLEAAEPSTTGPRGTVNAENLASRTVLAGFTIHGYDVLSTPAAGQPGRSSYGVYARNSPGLVVQNDHLVGGQGGDAAPAGAGTAGSNGGAGRDGLASRECATLDCAGESQAGGQPGSNSGCPSGTQGNAGAPAGPPQRGREQLYLSAASGDGLGGFDSSYAHSDASQASLCKYDCNVGGVAPGGAAQNGADGVPGGAGPSCTNATGAIANGEWVAAAAQPGGVGTPGRGGGGGGAGGGVINENVPGCTVGHLVGDLGATGGGGGAAGCGGGQGVGAASGGASFALFVAGAAPTVLGNLVDLGFGGLGGAGGAGGYGGLGGPGGRGGPNTQLAWCAGEGGPGGRGGNGGAGGGGGGGCGGSVYGLGGQGPFPATYAATNSVAPIPVNAAGLGGPGGASPAGSASSGGAGSAGVVAGIQAF